MMLFEETSVPDTALPVDAFKAHLRLGSGFDQDDVQDPVVASFLRAAMAAIEARTCKALLARAFSWTVEAWRDAAGQALPVAPVTAVTRLSVISRDGSETEIAAETYWLERDVQRPRLRASGAALPVIPQNGTAKIEFYAGYGASWQAVPADLQQAVLMLAAHYYEYRNDTALSDGCMPFGVTSLIERYKTVRLGGAS